MPKPDPFFRVKLGNLKRQLLLPLTVSIAAARVFATPTPDELEFFEKKVRPVLAEQCYKCHGPEKQKGKLRLDSLEATLKGGENGANIERGSSAKSGLVASVARLNEDEAMPPEGKGQPFSKEEVGLLRAWIDQGAK